MFLRLFQKGVEIAHDSENLYAVDLAPGAAGEVGQVIGRSIFAAEIPHLVARSLSRFVTGNWVPTAYEVNSSVAPAQEIKPQETTRWGTVTSVLEPSVEAVSALEEQQEHAASAAPDDATWVNPWVTDGQPQPVKPAEGLVEELEESPGLDPEAKPDVVPYLPDNPSYRSQINSLLGRTETSEHASSAENFNRTSPSAPPPAGQTSPTEKEAGEEFAAIAFGTFNPQDEHLNTHEPTPGLGTAAENPEYAEPAQATRRSHKNSEQQENSFMTGLRKFFLG